MEAEHDELVRRLRDVLSGYDPSDLLEPADTSLLENIFAERRRPFRLVENLA